MGKTFKGSARKRFGKKKTLDHRTRSQWSGTNGTRLRSLAADIADFQAVAGVDAETYHRPPNTSDKKVPAVIYAIEDVRSGIVEVKPVPKKKPKPKVQETPPCAAKVRRKKVAEFLNSLTRGELEVKKAHAARQSAFLHRLIKTLQTDYVPADKSFLQAVATLSKRQRHWDSLTGTIGPMLVERA